MPLACVLQTLLVYFSGHGVQAVEGKCPFAVGVDWEPVDVWGAFVVPVDAMDRSARNSLILLVDADLQKPGPPSNHSVNANGDIPLDVSLSEGDKMDSSTNFQVQRLGVSV